MRIIDARSGKDVSVGEWITYPSPKTIPDAGVCLPGHGVVDRASYRLLAVREGLMSAEADYELADGNRGTGQLTVRFMHPGFMFQKIAFVPS